MRLTWVIVIVGDFIMGEVIVGDFIVGEVIVGEIIVGEFIAVSYTHLTLPTNREV